ncbi:MAG: hypothetical protein HYS89_00030 [Candidatus Colwellbacteria bacterium]|nr:hypothetical protein [Candidatus Colwellbacteria bacterium]
MNRFLKQGAFGLLYLAILGLAGFAGYYFFLRPEASCFDNLLNQKETGTDCGGSCIPCELKGLELGSSTVQVIPISSNDVTLVAEVQNSSPNYSAFFSYNFEVTSKIGGVVDQEKGRAFIRPGQNKYLVVPAVSVDPRDVGRATLTLSDLGWNLSPIVASYKVQVTNEKTVLEPGRLKVTGELVNNSASASPALRLVTVVFDKDNKIVAASSSLVSSIDAFGKNQFTAFLPFAGQAPSLAELKTEIFWEEKL